MAGNCQRPVRVTVKSQPLRKTRERVWKRGRNVPMWLYADAPCRKCPACLRRRAAMWRMRAMTEWSRSSRTWLGTLTFEPDMRYLHVSRARALCFHNGIDYDALEPDEQYDELHRQCSRELTLFVKRLRSATGASLRYLIVAEAHKSGDPHYHLLVHESSTDEPVLYRHLKSAWTAGFSAWKLVKDERGLTYATKYLVKDARARVRASVAYGNAL